MEDEEWAAAAPLYKGGLLKGSQHSPAPFPSQAPRMTGTRTVLPGPAGKNLSVGKLCTRTASTSLAVESILAMMTSSWSLYVSPSLSQMGASCLQ